jgi:hypothetical protein
VRYFYDTEFIEDGHTIDLISIGIVADDGREYYAVNRDMPVRKIRKNPWLMTNVVPHLPRGHVETPRYMPARWLFNYNSPHVRTRDTIARQVRAFLLEPGCASGGEVELWADYAAYDHVVLAQLWGSMADLPTGIPMYTHDLQHEVHRLGLTDQDLPLQPETAHNALADARHAKRLGDYLAHLDTEQFALCANGPNESLILGPYPMRQAGSIQRRLNARPGWSAISYRIQQNVPPAHPWDTREEADAEAGEEAASGG